MRIHPSIITAILMAMGQRADAGETAAFARQLEYIKTQTYDVRYPNLRAREFIPVDHSVPTGAESFTWRAWDWAGMAKILANFADDLPKVDAMAVEITQPCRSIGDSYGYSIQDLRASAMAPGMSLDQKRASVARRAIENKIEQIAAFGDANANLPGFLNNSNVTILTASGSDIVGDWTNATPSEVLADLNTLANTVFVVSKGVHVADTMLLPLSRYSYIATTPMSVNDNRSILKVFLENTPYIKSVDQWVYLDLADAARTGPRAVVYARNNEVLELVIPQEFEQFPPQPKGLSFEIACHARTGGVSVRYPLAILYADGI